MLPLRNLKSRPKKNPLLSLNPPRKPRSKRIQSRQHPVPSRQGRSRTSDQYSHFLADGWTASFAPRFPAPPFEKGMLMPLEHGLGFHQLGRRFPSGPDARKQHPQEAKCSTAHYEARSLSRRYLGCDGSERCARPTVSRIHETIRRKRLASGSTSRIGRDHLAERRDHCWYPHPDYRFREGRELTEAQRPLAEVLHESQLGAWLIDLRIQDPSAIRRQSQATYINIPVQGFFKISDPPDLFGS
jgi:hypothetical protein